MVNLHDDKAKIDEICRRYGVHELLLFGSGLRTEFRPDSDLDFLVDFQPDAHIGLIRFVQMAQDLEAALHRKVDLVPKRGLKPLIREGILQQAEVIYAE
jgi:predicted nucleotidyltransferase